MASRVTVLPGLGVRQWWENAFDNRRVQSLDVLRLRTGNQRIVVINIPWYLLAGPEWEWVI
jgi:hypothetical protein